MTETTPPPFFEIKARVSSSVTQTTRTSLNHLPYVREAGYREVVSAMRAIDLQEVYSQRARISETDPPVFAVRKDEEIASTLFHSLRDEADQRIGGLAYTALKSDLDLTEWVQRTIPSMAIGGKIGSTYTLIGVRNAVIFHDIEFITDGRAKPGAASDLILRSLKDAVVLLPEGLSHHETLRATANAADYLSWGLYPEIDRGRGTPKEELRITVSI
jgi:hypothetical protein